MPGWLRWVLGLLIVASIVGVPFVYYRMSYAHSKRLREVAPGRFYRSGQLTAQGLREALKEHRIRLVINLQEEAQDPFIPEDYFSKPSIHESQVCRELGVKYVFLFAELLPPSADTSKYPVVIDQYRSLLDDPSNYPVLLHCKAGLHRTGLLTAIYRMEYEGWSKGAAVRELRANGFGDRACTTANEYLIQYIQRFEPRINRLAQQKSLPPEPATTGRSD